MPNCILCNNKISHLRSPVCDNCVKHRCFLSKYDLQKYHFLPNERDQLTPYHLNHKIQNETTLHFYGVHYLKEDIDNFITTDAKYIQRMYIENAKKSIYQKSLTDKKEEENYFINQRTLFLTAVLKKAGGNTHLSKYHNNYVISNYLNNGITGGRTLSEFEQYIIDLINFESNKNPKNKNKFKNNNDYNPKNNDKQSKQRIDMITSILDLSHKHLSSNAVYLKYIEQGIEHINTENIQNIDDLIMYLINHFANNQ